MRILFISPNRQTFVHPVPPLGMLYIAAGAKKHGHEVKVLDLMFKKRIGKLVEEAVREFSPELVGVSIRNVDTLFSKSRFDVPDIKECVDTVRQMSSAPIILGGSAFSIFPKELMETLSADFGIAGEADEAFPLFLSKWSKREDISDIPGLVQHTGNTWIINPPQKVENLDAIPFQAIEDIDWKSYGRYRGNFGVFTRKGCPLDCIYCPEAPIHGHKPRLRSPKRSVDEIEHIIDVTRLPWFDFADTLFNAPREHAVNVCEELIKRHVPIKYEVELNPVGQDEESVKLLKASGCIGVDLTADSGSNSMLENLRKGYTREMLLKTAELYFKHNIPYTVGFILGGPGENVTTLKETLNLADNLPGGATSYFAVGIRVFRGTELERIYCLDKTASGSLLPLNFYLSPDFDETCIRLLMKAYRRNFRIHLCDLMYEGASAFALKMADFWNIRPLWSTGRTLRIFDFVFNGGKIAFKWDKESCQFVKD
ncbi:MAG: cobalamin-dependent protein [Candidatus Riflebacteria bacterium]|nr:cobalamin-dependent protein [Candidatus Riflebacteria bacterium]